MIINKTKVSFAGRVPSPRYIPVGVMNDNCVECVEFSLPTIDIEQTATMLLDCKFADAITLERADNGLYCTDVTAQIAGESGNIKAYIRVDGANGAVWNSEQFFLCVCDVPDITGDISDKNPDALERTLTAIAQLNASMKQHTETMERFAAAASESAECAEKAANDTRFPIIEYTGVLAVNTVYTAELSGNVVFSLPVPDDISRENRIRMLARVAADTVIDWGTTTYYGAAVPFVNSGEYEFLWDYNPLLTAWVAGATRIGQVVSG